MSQFLRLVPSNWPAPSSETCTGLGKPQEFDAASKHRHIELLLQLHLQELRGGALEAKGHCSRGSREIHNCSRTDRPPYSGPQEVTGCSD